jgi:hypothetical protein
MLNIAGGIVLGGIGLVIVFFVLCFAISGVAEIFEKSRALGSAVVIAATLGILFIYLAL